jgi:PLP dependent protein
MSHLQEIHQVIYKYAKEAKRDPSKIHLLAVTKNRSREEIIPLLEEGQRLFGENRMQEAYSKWLPLKKIFNNIDLHFIGHLQTNKVKDAVALFDTIQTLDSLKLADKLAKEQETQKKNLRYLIEVNIGKEPQKTGIWPEDFGDFLCKLQAYYPLNIQGVMCIPPKNENPVPFFQNMKEIADHFQLPVISMGMSEDFKYAIQTGSTMLRLGTVIFEGLRLPLESDGHL